MREDNSKIEYVEPQNIEKRSFEIITHMLGDKKLDKEHEHIIKRCIHTSADFEYVDNLYFSYGVNNIIEKAFSEGCHIVTDTQMGKAGINKVITSRLGVEVHSFISDEDVISRARAEGVTRASICMEKAAKLKGSVILAIGNAPTALIKLSSMIKNKEFLPLAVIAVPVGFVNVIESKELIIDSGIPCIVSKGRKGGSNIAAAICNAILMKVTNKISS